MHETEYSKSGFWRRVEINVVLPAPDGAEMTNRMPERIEVRLFNVGKLFTNQIEFGLRIDDESADCGVRSFGP